MTTTRTLILMRHAKSGYPAGVPDHERPLAARGEREGALGGDWIRTQLPPVDAVLVSTAVRARATVAAAGIIAPTRLAGQIYEANPEDILEQIGRTAAAVSTLLVVGHSPGMPGLAAELAGQGGKMENLDQLPFRFPTSAIAVLETSCLWADLEFGRGVLVAFHIPRS